jgi:hypothetical protein
MARKTRFVLLASLGYIDLDDVIQVYNPNGGTVDLDNAPEIAVRFAAQVYDHNGDVNTNVVKLTNPKEIEMLIRSLGLLAAEEVTDEVTDSIGE